MCIAFIVICHETNLTINNITVRRSIDTLDNNFIHYWFINNGKVYEIYTWNADEDFDKNVEFMINSMSFSIFN